MRVNLASVFHPPPGYSNSSPACVPGRQSSIASRHCRQISQATQARPPAQYMHLNVIAADSWCFLWSADFVVEPTWDLLHGSGEYRAMNFSWNDFSVRRISNNHSFAPCYRQRCGHFYFYFRCHNSSCKKYQKIDAVIAFLHISVWLIVENIAAVIFISTLTLMRPFIAHLYFCRFTSFFSYSRF